VRVLRAPAGALALLVFCLGGAPRAAADIVALTSPAPATCVTDDGAVFSVENGALRPVRGQFMISPPGGHEWHPRTGVALDGEPGQLLGMRLWSAEPLDSLTVLIGTPGKNGLSRAPGFRAEVQQGAEEWVALIGIPPWTTPQEYTLTLTAASGQHSYILVQPFTVTARTFRSERIPLNAELTDMATVPDEKKKNESRVLAMILATPHPDAVFETGPFIVPIPGGRRTSGYADRREYDYSDGNKGYSVHLGVDIASPLGTAVAASGKGRVVFADLRIMTGNTVIIEHLPGLFSVYYHMSTISVKTGDVVEQGAPIGSVGMTGFATGPHLHWEVEAAGVAVDPDALVHRPLLDTNADFFDIEHAVSTEGR
jgi:murein DD-endopeptidase MepM/ murein hydrolase activator NlpD